MLDLDARLRRYVERLDEAYPDITVEEILGAADRPERLGAPRARPRGWLVAAAAAALVLVLIGGVALLARLVGEQTPPVVTQPEVEIETEALPDPDDFAFDPQARRALEEFLAGFSDAITVETSLGTWTWRRLELSLWDLIRQFGQPERTGPAPPEFAVAGMEWWHQYWENGGTASLGEVTASVVAAGVGVDWNAAYTYEPGWVAARWRDAPHLLEIVAIQDIDLGDGTGEHRDMGVLDVLEVSVVPGDPAVVEFHRQDGGELVLRLEATDPRVPAELMAQAAPSCDGLAGCPLVLRSLFVETSDDGGVWVDPPWLGRPVVDARIAVGADGLVLLAVEGTRESPTMRWWVSPDGLEWEEVAQAAPVVVPASGVEQVRLTGDGERLVLVLVSHVPGRPDGVSVWTSTDGSTWMPAQIDFGPSDVAVEVGAVPTSFGWMMPAGEWYGGQPQCVVWVSADGAFWERVPLFPRSLPAELASQCHGELPHGPLGEWFGTDTVLANTFDLWDDLGMWRGGFDE